MKRISLLGNNTINTTLLILSCFSFGCIFMYTMMSQNGTIPTQVSYNLPSLSWNSSQSFMDSSQTFSYDFHSININEKVSKRNKKWTEQIQSLINNTKRIQQISAVIIIFVQFDKIIPLIKHLDETLFQSKCMNWLSKYPFYIVSNDMNNESLNHQINETIHDSVHANNLRIIDITKYWKVSKHYLSSTDITPSTRPGFGTNYRIMCLLWGSVIFNVPEIAQFDYYMRLDDDSYLNCNCDKINQCDNFDPFIYMNKNNLLYGYWNLIPDLPKVSQYFASFMMSYMDRNQLDMHINNLIHHKSKRVDTFYNNWEIGYIAYFKSEPVQHFSKSVLESNGYFLFRWGDAIVRYFQIGLWLDKKYIWCMFDNGIDNYFNYKHDAKIFNKCKYHL